MCGRASACTSRREWNGRSFVNSHTGDSAHERAEDYGVHRRRVERQPGSLGGWGVIIVTPDGHVTELGGGAALTTNNKMELTGAIEALSSLQGTRGPVSIYTDSTYAVSYTHLTLPTNSRV